MSKAIETIYVQVDPSNPFSGTEVRGGKVVGELVFGQTDRGGAIASLSPIEDGGTPVGFGLQADGFAFLVTGKFSINGNTPQASAPVNAEISDSQDTTAVAALLNQIRAALIANGICVGPD